MTTLLSKSIIVFGALAAITATLSCSDSDETQAYTDDEARYLREEKAEDDSIHAIITLANLSDTIRNADGTMTYSPKYGEPIDETSPRDYYVGVESYEDAVEDFTNFIIPQDDEENITTGADGTITYNINGHGSLTFKPQSRMDLYAVVEVNFKELPGMERICFIPTSLWPENATTTPFTLGSVWQDNKNTSKYYICVREKQYGPKGLMIALSGNQDEWTLTRYRGSNGATKNALPNYIYRDISTSDEALCALNELVNNLGRDAARRLFKAAHVQYDVEALDDVPFLYNTNVGNLKFHWGPSDHHYRIYIDQITIGLNRKPAKEHIEYNTCNKKYQRDQGKESFHFSKSFEFDYMPTSERNSKYTLVY